MREKNSWPKLTSDGSANVLRGTVSFGTVLTWTLVYSLWKQFTPIWNQSSSRNPL